MGIIWSYRDQSLHVSGLKDLKGKGKQQRIRKLNLMLPSLELKTSSMMNLSTQGRTKEKVTMGKKKSSVRTAGRVFTLNMPAWRKILMKKRLCLRGITSIFQRAFGGEITKIRNHSMRKVMPSWKALRSPKNCWLNMELRTTWWWKRLLFIPGDRQIHSHPHGRWLHHHFRRTRYCRSRKWFFF